MKRINKTQNNLQEVWEHLDVASGSIYNALESLDRMVGLGDESDLRGLIKGIERLSVDVTWLDGLKDDIEKLIEDKGKNTL